MISKRVMLMALSNRQSYVKNVCKITCTVRQYASKKESGFFSKMMNRVTGSKETEESELAREELERADRYIFVGTEVNEVESNWSSTVKKSNAPNRCYDLHMTVSQKYKHKD